MTLLEAADRIADHEEPEAGDAAAPRSCATRASTCAPASRSSGSTTTATFHVRVGGETLDADQLLVAAGRSNNLGDVGLETVGLDPEADAVEVDERLRAADRLWAVGDITGKGAFTHVSRYQAAGAVRGHPRPRTVRRPTTGRSPGSPSPTPSWPRSG